MSSLYLHVPFCSSICPYCAFARSVAQPEKIQAWKVRILEELKEKLNQKKQEDPAFSLSTIYFGGGTPSILPAEIFEPIAKVLQPYIQKDAEWTMECNPESVSPLKLELWKKYGVSRISLGVQSFQDSLLAGIRSHTKKQAIEAVYMTRKAGIGNISIDLMFGLPGQNMAMLKEDLKTFLDLNLPHLSIYSLQIEENSLFAKQNVSVWDEDEEADAYETIARILEENGYSHYEISSYARDNMYSRHNLMYWSDEDYLGIGYGACWKEKGARYENAPSLQAYLSSGAQSNYVKGSREDAPFEAVMMGLRTTFGLDVQRWNQMYQMDFLQVFQDVLKTWSTCIELSENHLHVNEKGMEVLNSILVDFYVKFDAILDETNSI